MTKQLPPFGHLAEIPAGGRVIAISSKKSAELLALWLAGIAFAT
jgi:hypothetical protein